MSNAGGYTEPGPIHWDVEQGGANDPAFWSRPAVVMVARTPEHPATDRRFSVRLTRGEVVAAATDSTDPETPDRWPTLARAIIEVERTIRAAWYEGGGGERVPPKTAQAERLADRAATVIAEYRSDVEHPDARRFAVEDLAEALADYRRE